MQKRDLAALAHQRLLARRAEEAKRKMDAMDLLPYEVRQLLAYSKVGLSVNRAKFHLWTSKTVEEAIEKIKAEEHFLTLEYRNFMRNGAQGQPAKWKSPPPPSTKKELKKKIKAAMSAEVEAFLLS